MRVSLLTSGVRYPVPGVPSDVGQSVQLLTMDPELGRELDAQARAEAVAASVARVVEVPAGARGRLGVPPVEATVVVLDGLLLRLVVDRNGRSAADVFDRGDVTDSRQPAHPSDVVPFKVEWLAVEDLRLAVLDGSWYRRMARWPDVLADLVARAAEQGCRQALTAAISRHAGLAERMLMLLWFIAERRGVVRREGVYLELPLSHLQLSYLCGSRRPSVSTALGDLAREGLISRCEDGWVLHGEPPEMLAA